MITRKHKISGHIEIGFTLAIVIIIALFAYFSYVSQTNEIELLDLWLSWPWWAKLLSVIVPIILLFLGSIIEKSRQWPK